MQKLKPVAPEQPLRRSLLAHAAAIGITAAWLPSQALAAAQGPNSPEAQAWTSLLEKLEHVAESMVRQSARPSDPALHTKALDHTLQMLSIAYLNLFQQDERNPDWRPIQNNALPTAAPNPDTMYYAANIDGTGTYRISGWAGSVFHADLQWGKGKRGVNYPGARLDSVSLADLERRTDGYFELVLSQQRPAGYTGNWRYLDPAAATVTLRSISRDWRTEVDPRLSIQRLDVPPRPSTLPGESFVSRLGRMEKFIDQWTQLFANRLPAAVRQLGINQIKEFPLGNSAGGLKNQFYFSTAFDVPPGHALLIESALPRHFRYWNMQLTDEFLQSLDYVDLQCSLNDFQAKADSDSTLRVVICGEDPGVHNWLDTGGARNGLMLGRWLDMDSTPMPQARLLPLADLRAALPADTPTVSATERAQALAARREGAQWRRRW